MFVDRGLHTLVSRDIDLLIVPCANLLFDQHHVCSDDGIRHGIEIGNLLSRSLLYYFKHNDMGELESVLKDIVKTDKPARRWIIVEV
jgi:7-keto-8-aminopelargonate synthetase-like enzyme